MGQGNTSCENAPSHLFWKVNKLLMLFCLWSSVSSSFVLWSGRLEEKSWVVVGTRLSRDSPDYSLCVLGIPLTLQQ